MARIADRENLMKLMYQMELQKDFTDEAFEIYMENQLKKDPGDYFGLMFRLIRNHMSEIDDCINRYSRNWKTERMPKVDLAILRIACAELMYLDDIPVTVAANEAVNLAKNYSTEKSAKFINGVLASVAKDRSGNGQQE